MRKQGKYNPVKQSAHETAYRGGNIFISAKLDLFWKNGQHETKNIFEPLSLIHTTYVLISVFMKILLEFTVSLVHLFVCEADL